MSLLVKMTLSAALVLSIGVPFGAFAAGEKTKGRYKTALGVNVFLFFGTMIAAAAFIEDSSILGKSLIFVGLAEGVCLYGLIISFMILGKL